MSYIVETADYYWGYWDRYKRVPAGCYRQHWDKPFFFVCPSNLTASRDEVTKAYAALQRRYSEARVNSRRSNWDVFDYNEVSDRAAFWTLEYGNGRSEPGDDKSKICLVIRIDNEKR